MRRPYLKADLARDLGLSPASITKLAKRGMPVHSAAAAREWRRTHLDPAWTKRATTSASAPVAPADQALAIVQRLAAVCAAGDPTPLLEQLRVAMRAVPPEARDSVELDVRTWNALVGDVLRQIQAEEQKRGPLSEEDLKDDDCGDIVYSLACGEARHTPAESSP